MNTMAKKKFRYLWVAVISIIISMDVWGSGQATLISLNSVNFKESPQYRVLLPWLNRTVQVFQNGSPLCSGSLVTIFDRLYVLTASHCLRIKEGSSISAEYSIRQYTFTVQKDRLFEARRRAVPFVEAGLIKVRDLALLPVQDSFRDDAHEGIEFFRILENIKEISVGKEYRSMGYANEDRPGEPLVTMQCQVKAIRHEDGEYEGDSCPLRPGLSGGPQFDSDGVMIGINSIFDETAGNLVIAPFAGDIVRELRNILEDKESRHRGVGSESGRANRKKIM